MSFNRLALAAALLEYDGTNKAKDSALFAPAPLTAKDGHNKYATFHGDSTDHPDHSDKSSAVDDPVNSINPIKSDIAKSVEAYRAGFNTPYPIHQQRELDENNKFDDVDLDSWGLDQFLVKSSSSDLPPPPPLRPQPGEARASKNRTLSDAANVSDIAAVAYHTSHSERARDDSSLANLNLFRDSSAVDIAREPQADSSDKEGRERAQSSLGFYRDAKSDFTLPPFEFTSKADPEIINSTTTEHRKSADSYRSDIPPHLRPSLPKEDNVKTVSRNTLLRPKTLIMPAPLQGSLDDINVHRDDIDFHHISTELKVPLPQALKRAREQKRHTALAMNRASVAVPLNSKSEHGVSFTNRNSRASVFAPSAANSHAQGPHVGSSAGLPTAQSEGEQAQLYDEELEDEYDMAMVRARKIREMDTSEMQPGTIFGSSLMDDIDSRKQAQKDKRRFFRGDERPQGSTADGRESSAPVITRMQSVFGVDELWQRDQAKAETLAAAEKADTERKQRLAVEKEQNRLLKKSNKKNLMSLKGSPSKQSLPQTPSVSVNDKENADATSESLDTGEVAPPQAVTPSMQNETVLGVSKWFNGSDSGSTHLPSGRPSIDHEPKQFLRPKRNEQWRHAPRKSIVPASSRAPDGSLPPVELLQSSQSIGPENSDEEDTMPISNIIRSRSQESDLRANIKVENDESEDERPLSTFIRPSRTPSEQVLMPKIQVELPGDSEREVQKEEDEDDVPLGLKHPQMNSHGQSRLEDDDDVALGSRPAAAAFQQRNSMYPAASRQSNMSFGYPGSTMSWNPAAMGGYPQMPMAGMSTMSMPMQMPPMGGFAPPYGVYPGMGMDPMMMAQMQAPSIPQLSAPDLQAPPHAQNIQEKQTKKINSIDQWRRDVQNVG